MKGRVRQLVLDFWVEAEEELSEGGHGRFANDWTVQRQTVVSQFFQLDKLVVEGGKTGKQTGNEGGIVRQKDHGYVTLIMITN